MKRNDLIDVLCSEWRSERPELDSSGMGVVGRAILLGELLKKAAHEALAPFDLGYTDLDVLATLRRSGEPYELRPSTLLRTALIQSGSMTACLDRLDARGLVVRVPIPDDRRGRMVRLTEKGKVLVDKAIEARFAVAAESVRGLSLDERRILEEALRSLILLHEPAALSAGGRS